MLLAIVGDAPKIQETLNPKPWLSPNLPFKVIDSILRGIANVCFANNPTSGLLILIGLFIGDIYVGVAAVLCSLVAIATAKFLEQDDGAITAGLTNFSAVLVGTVTASLYPVFFNEPLSGFIWIYMVVAAVFSVCVGSGLGVITGMHSLPAYTLPFNIATSITFICLRARGFGHSEELPVPESLTSMGIEEVINATQTNEIGDLVDDGSILWDKVFIGTLLSAGQVYAVESVACSVLTLAGLMICSPLLTIACYIGGAVGTFTALAVTSAPYNMVYAGVWGYNAFLSAGCLSFFMVPRPKVLILALVNAVFTTFLQSAIVPVFAANQLPVFTFPFCISSLLFLALATSTGLGGSERVASPTFPEYHLISFMKESKQTEKRATVHSTEKGEIDV